jgi:integrase
MADYNPKNERIKKDYFRLLAEADQKGNTTIDGIRKAIHRFEAFTGFADFVTFNQEQAIAFKKHLSECKAKRTATPLSQATVLSTMNALQAFLRWLAREPGYRTKIKAADIRYLNLSRKDVSIAGAPRTRKVPTLEQIRTVVLGMPAGSDIERRNQALVAFAIVTGMRDSAIASLRLKHVDLDQRLVIQDPSEVKTKFSKRIETFFFPIGDDLEQIVIDWVRYLREVKLYGHDDPVFPRTKVSQNAELTFEADGVGPTVVVVNEGVARNLSTSTLKDDAYAFIFDQQGLMAGVSIEGTKISRIDR